MINNINKIREKVKDLRPLIHCITNPISINQCANAVLAVGASPIMAEHPAEVAEITQTAKAAVYNIGNITDVRMQSIKLSAKAAQENSIPFVLDIVGICCSSLRRKYITEFLAEHKPSIIKGNYSEIMALHSICYSCAGVDADDTLKTENIAVTAQKLARKYKTVIAASGKTDIVTDGEKTAYISNGTNQLTKITGTGCMQGALCGVYLSVTDSFSAAVAGCTVLGICGELSQTEKGTGSFMVNLMDNLSSLKDSDIKKLLKIEVKYNEQT